MAPSNSAFRFGLEAEFLLIEADSFQPLWHPQLRFDALNSLLESIDVDASDDEGLDVRPPHLKPMPFVVEGYQVPDPKLRPTDLLPKGIEIRTPVRDSIEEASVSLGVPPLKSFFKVVMPLIGPAVAAAAILMWVTSLSELSATIVLYYGGMSTMPIEIFQQVDSGRLAPASAYSVILMLAIFLPLAIARWVFRVKVDSLQ